jgi:hypothetical protein
MTIEKVSEELEKVKKELKIEKDKNELEFANIKSNYITNILILLGFLFYIVNPDYKFLGINSLTLFWIFVLIVGLWFWKDMKKYSNFLVKKIIGMKV